MPVQQQLKEKYKEKISAEIQGLSETEIEKIIKIIHLLKTEFLGKKRETSIENFRKAKGAWRDVNVEWIYNLH